MTTQTTTKPAITVVPKDGAPSQQIVSRDQMVNILMDRKGCSFASIRTEQDMDARGKMKKTNNPFHGLGMVKRAKTSVMVTFDYAKSMETRGDKASGKGSWSQAVVREDGSLTPLSVHKGDVESKDGEPQKRKVNARYYLRCEYRSSESKYVMPTGIEVAKDEVLPFLPKRQEKTVDFHTVSMHTVKSLTIDHVTYVLQ